MKKIIVLMITTFFSISAMAIGLSWESITGLGNEKIEPVAYNIEVNGNNLRVYEWISPTAPRQKCVFVASERNTNLQCTDIAGQIPDSLFEEVNQ